MIKQLITDYSFSPQSKQVILSGFSSILLEQILLITNVTTNTIIYNFANEDLGGTVTDNVVSLDYDTSTMNASDSLQIFVEADDNIMLGNQYLLGEISSAMASVASARGILSDIRVSIVGGNVGLNSSQTLGTVTNQSQMAGMPLAPLVMAQSNYGAYQGNINNVGRA